MAIDGCDGAFAFAVIAHLHKAKPSGLARFAVRNDADAVNPAICLKERAEILLGGAEAQITYKNILQ